MSYRRDEMRAAAAARGWDLSAWAKVAGVSRWNCYDFMRGRTSAPRVAEALTRALGQPQGFYQVRAGGKRASA